MMERLKESRWLYILVSVLIAVAFWLYIRNVQNTASDYTIYNVPVQITNSRVLNERGLTVASLSQDTVNVTVNAPWSVQRNLNRNNIVATVDVSTITEAGSFTFNSRGYTYFRAPGKYAGLEDDGFYINHEEPADQGLNNTDVLQHYWAWS